MAPIEENYDDFIEHFEYNDYRPPQSEDINQSGGEFPINVHSEDIITLPCESLLVFHGQIKINEVTGDSVKKSIDVDPKKIRFDTNGILHRFDHIEYKIGDNKIDDIRKPGIATTMKGLLSFQPNMSRSLSGWDIYPNATNLINAQGYFTVIKPLSEVMGFFEDFGKCMVRIPQSLIFHNSTTSDHAMVYSDQTTYSVTVTFKEIIWRMRHVKLRIDKEIKLRKEVLGNTNFSMLSVIGCINARQSLPTQQSILGKFL